MTTAIFVLMSLSSRLLWAEASGERFFKVQGDKVPILGDSEGRAGGVLRIRKGGEPPTLNPIIADGYEAVDIQFYVIEALLLQNEDSYQWQPWLADQWEISKDGRSFTFHIRDEARWSDGQPVTADDVKFSLDVIFDDRFPTAHLRPYYESIKAVEVLSRKKVRFHTKNKYFGNFLSCAALPIVPKHFYGDPDEGPNIHYDILGSGPYKLEEFNSGRNVILKKNPQWWGLKDPLYKNKFLPEKVVFQFVGDDQVALEMMRKGTMDFVALTTKAYLQYREEAKTTSEFTVNKVKNRYPRAVTSVALNQDLKIFQDQRVRKGLNHLMNRELVIDKFFRGLKAPASGPWYKQSPFSDPSVEPLTYDPKKALNLFRQSGWKDIDRDRVLEKKFGGQLREFRFTILTPDASAARCLSVLKEDAKKAGVVMDIKVLGWNALSRLVDEGKYEAVQVSTGGGQVEFDPLPAWHSSAIGENGYNWARYKSPQVDRWIEQARRTLDFDERKPIMRKIYRKIASDLPNIFLFNDVYSFYAHSPRVRWEKPTYQYDVGLKYWWIAQPQGVK